MVKKIFIITFAVFFLNGCKTKFDVNGEYKEIPIVHFLLDQGEEYHFLKLNKTFLQEGNALDFAKKPELSYFDKVNAVVEEVKNGAVFRTWTLKDTIIHNKAEGAFYAPDQKLYYFKENNLDENAIYRLHIDIDNGNHIVKGQTELVKDVAIKYPLPNQSFNFADNDVPKNGYRNVSILFTKSPNGAIYKTQYLIYYKEFRGGLEEQKSLTMELGEMKATDILVATPSVTIRGERFYDFLGDKIKGNDVDKRVLEALEIKITIGSEDLNTYMLINEPSSSLAQNKPTYSNVEGGLGIFSSRLTVRQYMPAYVFPQTRALNQNSTRELCAGPYTSKHLFCSDVPLDASRPFACH